MWRLTDPGWACTTFFHIRLERSFHSLTHLSFKGQLKNTRERPDWTQALIRGADNLFEYVDLIYSRIMSHICLIYASDSDAT